MEINSYMYAGSSGLNSILSNRSSGTSWRSGVIGWEQKETGGSSSSSTSGVSSEAASYLTSVKDFGAKLLDAMQSLSGNDKTASIFDSLGASSSNTSALTVSITDQAKAKDFLQAGGEKKIEVFQLAEAQQNKGGALAENGNSGVNTGKNSFSIEKDGKAYDFSVDVNMTDSNRTVQQKAADAINEKNMGVKATVQYNQSTKESRLVLTSTETGEDNGFTVSDKGTGNVVSELGVGSATRSAQDARYSVDGVEEVSSSNQVDIGDGMNAKLLDETDKDVTVKAGENQSGITNKIYDFVNNFNQLRETAANMSDDSNAKRLQDRLDSLTSAYSSVLKKVGITTNSSGYLDLDKEKMNESILNGDAEKALGKDSSFTKSMTSLAAQAEDDPGRFLSYKTKTATDESEESSALSSYEEMMTSFSPYQAMQINHWDMVGMLFSAGF